MSDVFSRDPTNERGRGKAIDHPVTSVFRLHECSHKATIPKKHLIICVNRRHLWIVDFAVFVHHHIKGSL